MHFRPCRPIWRLGCNVASARLMFALQRANELVERTWSLPYPYSDSGGVEPSTRNLLQGAPFYNVWVLVWACLESRLTGR